MVNFTFLILGILWFSGHGETTQRYDYSNRGSSISRRWKPASTVVYVCDVPEGPTGLCLETSRLCKDQGGEAAGFCVYNNNYRGICCTGIGSFGNRTELYEDEIPFSLEKYPTFPSLRDDTTSVTITIPALPTITTPALPTITTPALPTITTPALPTITTPGLPTITTPGLPTITTPGLPTITTPGIPTITTPGLPTITTPGIPTITTPALPTVTLPSVPTVTTPALPTVTLPSVPTVTTPALPTVTLPSVPTVTTPALPTVTLPSVPTVTTPALPTVTVPALPTVTTPGLPTVTIPQVTLTTQPLPTLTTPQVTVTIPPVPTLTTPQVTVTVPPLPTLTTPQVTLTTQALPPVTIPTVTAPPAPTLPTTQAIPTFPPFPADTSPTTANPWPTFPTQTFPTFPTMTTQTFPTFPTQTFPTFPTQTFPTQTFPTFTTQTFPTQTFPTQTFPTQTFPTQTFPTIPTQTFPTFSTQTFPTIPTQTFPTFSTQTFPTIPTQTFPTFSTQTFPTIPTQTFPTQTFPTQTFPTFPTQTFPTQTFPTQTFPTFPTSTIAWPTFPTIPTTTAPPPAAPPNSPDCNTMTPDIVSSFTNPSYPAMDSQPSVCQYVVFPQEDYCALRIDIVEAFLATAKSESCSVDSIQIINSGDSPTSPQCGLIQNYQFTVRMRKEPITILATAQSEAHLWNINVTQIKCSKILPIAEGQMKSCGMKNTGRREFPLLFPTTRELEDTAKFLRSKRRGLAEIYHMSGGCEADKLVEKAAVFSPTMRIVGGNETGINEWPWQGLLMVNGRPLCGASVINEDTLITAGHCVKLNIRLPLALLLTVDLGDHDLRTTTETNNMILRVKKVIPNIQTEGVSKDIALIKLANKIPMTGRTIRPVCLPTDPDEEFAGDEAVMTGWGRTENSVISPVLKEAELTVITRDACREAWSKLGEGGGSLIENGMICAKGGIPGPCNGDSGGPLVREKDGKWELIGLTSFGSLRGCALPDVPPVFTRVASYLDWIALNLAEA